ncbi:MAG: FAD-dependent oxidoreductase [Chitinophagaceae bacterium]
MIFTKSNCNIFLVGILLNSFSAFSQSATFDVIVYGGTAGGFTAAIQVAKMGKSVALLEPGKHIGGISVEGLGSTDIDNHPEFQNSFAVGGLAMEFYRRIAIAYGREKAFDSAILFKKKLPLLWRFESSVAEKVIREWLAEYNIKLYYQSHLSENKNAVVKKSGAIATIRMEDGKEYKAKIFIDATIEGDLLAAAGVTTIIGRESNFRYHETLNGIRAVTDHNQFAVKVDPYKTPGDPLSGVIPTIQDEPFGIPGEGDKSLQAYCFRVCLTKNKDNQVSFTTPAGYNRSEYEIYIRYEKAGGKLYKPSAGLPNGKTDLNGGADLSHNLYGMNRDYPGGSYAVKEKVLSYHKNFTQGLFYFLANDTAVTASVRNEWSQWGLCKDEFTDNGGWPRMFYVRDARRMVSDYIITQHHGSSVNPVPVEDPIAVAYWPMDVHSARRIIKDGYAYNEGFVFGGNYWRPFGVSYRAMVPKRSECNNLLTPTCLSASHIAYGAIRLEYNYMTQGQACAIAAVLAIKTKKTVQDIAYETLKSELLKQGAVINASVVGVPKNK